MRVGEERLSRGWVVIGWWVRGVLLGTGCVQPQPVTCKSLVLTVGG